MHELEIEKEIKNIKKRTISLSISKQIAQKIDQHLLVRKNFLNEINMSKHKWAQEAVKEKLEKEKNVQSCLIKNKSFNFELPKDLEDKINKRVDFAKKFSKSFSRKKWFLEAFLEKIEDERDVIKEHLDRSFDSLKQ